MTDKFEVDVLICGAGAAGLTLAIALARDGIAVRLIDKIDQPFAGSRGKGIQPRSLEIFEDLGVVHRILAAGNAYPLTRSYAADGTHADSAMMEGPGAPDPSRPYRCPWMVPQFATEAVLRERLAELGHAPMYSHELVSFEQDDEGVVTQIATPNGTATCHSRFLVASDGGRSTLREMLGIGFPGSSLGVRAVVADLALEGLSREFIHRFDLGSKGDQLLLTPLGGTDLFQLQAGVPLDGDVDITLAGLNAMIAARSGRSDLAATAVSWASLYSMSARLADTYRIGRIYLAGDAAHIHPPTGAQGLNTSVQDAYNLAWKLAATLRGGAPALLDSYEQERRPVAAAMLGMTAQLLKEQADGPMRRGRDVQQLDIGYDTSAISAPHSKIGKSLRPGDRAPDAVLADAAGRAVRLYEIIQGPEWHVFGSNPAVAAIRPRKGLRVHRLGHELYETEGNFSTAYGLAPDDVVVIRPDGYVAGTFAGGAIGVLNDYLSLMGLPRSPGSFERKEA